MDAPGPSSTARDIEREHLARAHHEICTALTVFCSNVELVRLRLRDARPEGALVPVHVHLDEIEGAVERLRDVAREMKRWHDGLAPRPGERRESAPGEQAEQVSRPSA